MSESECVHDWQVARIKTVFDFNETTAQQNAGLWNLEDAYVLIVCLRCDSWQRRDVKRSPARMEAA